MPSVSLTAGLPPRDRIELVGLAAVLGIVAAMQLSIAAAQILLAVAILCWLVSHLTRAQRLAAPAFFWPLVVYAVWTLVAAGFSADPTVSVTDCKQLVLLMLVPVVYDVARGPRANTLLTIVLSIGAASAFIGVVQYGLLNYDDLGRRAQGTLSHWMTYSGTLMLVICAAAARLIYSRQDRLWAAFVLPALVAALAITSTRGAWLGAAAGVGTLLAIKNVRLLAILPVAGLVLLLVAPAALITRASSMFDPNDPTRRDRVAMLEAGVAIVRDHPVVGVGPDMISRVYPGYRLATAVDVNAPHLHNVPMQIAAERGLPALGLWLWFVAAAVTGLWQLLRQRRVPALAAAGLGAMVAMLVAGQFEYNFGDSEFLMLLLVLITLPFAAARDGERS